MSNFPLWYRASWLPRLLSPSLAGGSEGFAPAEDRWLPEGSGRAARLVFLGDISAVANAEPPEIDPSLRAVIADADLVVANCESPVVAAPAFPLATRFGLRHAMTPAWLDAALEAAGIPPERLVLSLANNHALDQGTTGFDETVAALAERGIRTIGMAAGGPVRRIEAGALGLGFLAFTQWRNAGASAFAGRVATLDCIGGWREHVPAVDLLCAVPHWDREFRHFPADETRMLARTLVRDGVGMIVGGHAHVVQAAEKIDGALVAYGLGDFLGTALARAPLPLRIGAVLSVEIGIDAGIRGKVMAYRLVPFLRTRHGRHERLTPLDAAPESRKAAVRFAAIFRR